MKYPRRARQAIAVVIAGLVASGVTAFPLLHEIRWVHGYLHGGGRWLAGGFPGLAGWIGTVKAGLEHAHEHYPFLAYGTDWLAYGHLVIALFFVLPWRDPVRYAGVLQVGVIASLAVIPVALACGAVRGISVGWRLIDCAFGVFCLPPL